MIRATKIIATLGPASSPMRSAPKCGGQIKLIAAICVASLPAGRATSSTSMCDIPWQSRESLR